MTCGGSTSPCPQLAILPGNGKNVAERGPRQENDSSLERILSSNEKITTIQPKFNVLHNIYIYIYSPEKHRNNTAFRTSGN